MKKVTLLAAVAFLALSVTSCKKDYTCACKNAALTIDYPLGKQKKKDATTTCDGMNSTWKIGGGSCSLK